MFYYAFYDNRGVIVQTAIMLNPLTTNSPREDLMPVQITENQADVVQNPQNWRVDLARRVIVPVSDEIKAAMSERRPWQEFDTLNHVWIDTHTHAQIIAAVGAEIERLRDRGDSLPIETSIGLLDADERAKSNINGKISEITALEALGRAGDSTPEQRVWRDHNNVNHHFDTLTGLRTFLSEVTVALAQRRTALYLWSWQAKERLQGAKTRQDVLDLLADLGIDAFSIH